MKSPFDNIKIGRINRSRKRHNFSRDVNTTASIGFVQPLGFIETLKNEKIMLKTRNAVRLMPMVAPTFGRLKAKYYHRFVPAREVCKNFEALLTGTTVRPANSASYVPQSVPTMSIKMLTWYVMQFSQCTVWEQGSDNKWRVRDMTGENVSSSSILIPNDYTNTNSGIVNFINFGLGNKVSNHAFNDSTETPITVDGADFVTTSDEGEFVAWKLNFLGLNFRKILLGLGYQLDPSNEQRVSLLPLFAFYKAYYDLFFVNRKQNWEQTNLYNLIDLLFEYGISDLDGELTSTNTRLVDAIYNSFYWMSQCWYTDNPDYFTASSDGTAMNESSHVVSQIIPTDSGMSNYNGVKAATNRNVTIPVYNSQIAQVSLEVARRLYKLVNAETTIGSNVRKLLISRYGSAINEGYNPTVGTSELMCDISDVNSMAATEYGTVGDFSGKGMGFNESKEFVFDCPNEQGFLISLCCVVPVAKYVQGIDRNLLHKKRYDFYTPDFDAVGLQTIEKGEYLGSLDVCEFSAADTDSSSKPQTQTFGLIPRYTEYKTQPHNIANGNISLRSSRDSYLPYILDRWFTMSSASSTPYREGVVTDIAIQAGYVPTVVDYTMRYIGNNGVMGNFNRIFQTPGEYINSTHTNIQNVINPVDQFILHNVFLVTRINEALPIADSYETDSNENAFEVEHM